MTSPSRSPQHGFALIEVMVAMGVLAVGLLAMWHLHMIGLTSTSAGRRHTVASAIAGELAAGLERLDFNNALLDQTGPPGPSAPAPFGALVYGLGTITPGARAWDDTSMAVPGVRRTSEMHEMAEASANYQRSWTVWAVSQPGGLVGSKVVAVSVVWRDPPFQRPREVVQYTYVANPAVIGVAIGSSP